jgi:AcrR family transcriptional regulator
MKDSPLRIERERQRREENRESILHAAEEVISRKGCAAATMDDIARESAFSKATLYKYFPSKSELVFEILIHFFEDIRSRLAEIQAGSGGACEKLRRSVRMVLDFHEEKENISRVLMMDTAVVDVFRIFVSGRGASGPAAEQRLVGVLRAKRREVFVTAADIIREGIALGEFRPVDIPSALTFIDDALQGFVHNRAWLDGDRDPGEAADMLFGFILEGLGPGPESPKET